MKFFTAVQSLLFVVLAQQCKGKRLKDGGGLRGAGQTLKEPPRAILDELEEVLGQDHTFTKQKLNELEKDLNVTFKALAKNSQGAIDAPSVRYALHRLFVQRYGWQVKGLETDTGSWDADSPIKAMGDRVPQEVRELFGKRLQSSGLTLHELAVVAATMDTMFHVDVRRQLLDLYDKKGISENETLDSDTAVSIMTNYIMEAFTVLHPDEVLSPSEMSLQVSEHDLLMRVLINVVPNSWDKQQYSIDLVAKVLALYGEEVGRLENEQCKVMKDELVKVEHRPGSGRVRLGDFYKYHQKFEFGENVNYLRAAGALDESEPDDPKVMIPNYLTSSANCVYPSDFFEICCFDVCEELMDRIEAKLEAPVASTDIIVSIVSTLSNRSLPAQLQDLLQQVARHHGGLVPIHGRLFAQWMHQAYPRDCNQPRSSYDSKQIRYQETRPEMASGEERARYAILAARKAMNGIGGKEGPPEEHVPSAIWTLDEQLVSMEAHTSHVMRSGMPDSLIFALELLFCMAILKFMSKYQAYRRSQSQKKMKIM